MRPPRARQRGLLLAGLLLLAPRLLAAQVEVQHIDISAQFDPRFQALYASARLTLRNAGRAPLDLLAFDFPAPLGPHARVRTVWDEKGQLEWRSDPADEDSPRELRVVLRSPLRAGKKLVLGVSYEFELASVTAAEAPAAVSSRGARLATTGWYPLPAGSEPAPPRALRLAVRLPKEWQVSALVGLKTIRRGTALTAYELSLEPVEPGRTLLRAEAASAAPP